VAVQTPVNCHCQLEENLVGSVEPVQLVVLYLTQAAIKLPSAGDNARSSVQHQIGRYNGQRATGLWRPSRTLHFIATVYGE